MHTSNTQNFPSAHPTGPSSNNRLIKLLSGLLMLTLVAACSDSSNSGSSSSTPLPPEPVLEDPLDFLDRSLVAQVEAVESGRLDCEALVLAYRERISIEDEGEGGINSLISIVEDPAALAGEVNSTLGQGLSLQCGIIVLKDNIDMAGLPTTAGSLALADNLTEEDSTLAARIRERGALLLGKSNLSEWAAFRGYGTTSGWSSLGGQTLNGFDGKSDPCGSSSGSAAAVAAGLVAGSVGTETAGSIVCPASTNGVVGLKPTVGLVSRSGVIPISFSLDTAGPIARTVSDAARMLSAMAGEDPADPATAEIPPDLNLDFEAQLEGASLEGVRLGVINSGVLGAPDAVEPIDVLFQEQLTRLEAAGATLVPVDLDFWPTLDNDKLTVFYSEYKPGLNNYLVGHAVSGQVTSITELVIFNSDNAETVMPYFGQEHLQIADALSGLDTAGYPEALDRLTRLSGEEGIDRAMMENDLDALISPTAGPTMPLTYSPGSNPLASRATIFAAFARYPHITVPMGLVDGLPIGLSVVAGAWQDARVLNIAYAFEQLE